VLFDTDMNRQSVIVGPGRTKPKTRWVRGKNQIITVSEKWPVPKTLNLGGLANFKVLYLNSGFESSNNVRYRKFPIRDYKPTQVKCEKIFRELVGSVKL
jgi:hypothetical protein